jgi:hypothetical protein
MALSALGLLLPAKGHRPKLPWNQANWIPIVSVSLAQTFAHCGPDQPKPTELGRIIAPYVIENRQAEMRLFV